MKNLFYIIFILFFGIYGLHALGYLEEGGTSSPASAKNTHTTGAATESSTKATKDPTTFPEGHYRLKALR